MATIQYARLYPDTTQLQAKDGHNLTAGWVMVFLAGTDDPATTYADFNGTVNPQKIVIDDNGRFCAIVDKAKAYRVEVYDSEGMLQWTTEPVWCTGNAGSGMSVTRVISTDGSISVDENIAGTERTYDIGIAPADNDEFLEWIKCSEEDCGSTWKPVYQAGTMETEAGQGIKVHGGHLYHFTNTFYVDPDGTGITYSTFQVNMYCNGEIVDSRNFDIDTSVNDSVQCEFSTDVIPEEDGHVYFTLNIPSGCEVTGEVQCHRIYSGINAVPDTCATKQWVSEYYQEKSGMSAYIPFSGINYNSSNQITGISGSAIYAALDKDTVSSIASSYAESAVSSISGWSGYFSSISSKVDQSAFDDCCSAVHSALDDKLDKSASGLFQLSGDYAYNSSLSSYIPASSSGMFQPSGNYQSAGDYAFNSSVSSKLDASASGDFVLNSSFSSYSSNVGDTINNMSSSITSIENNITSIENNLTSISSDVSGKVDETAMSAWIPYSALDYSGTAISGIGGSSLAGMGGGGADYTGVAPVNVDNDTRLISVDHRTLCVDETLTAYNSGSSAVLGVNTATFSTEVKHDYNLSGNGTSAQPLGLASAITLSSNTASTKIDDFVISQHYEDGYTVAIGGQIEVADSGTEDGFTCVLNKDGQQMVSGHYASSITGIKLMMHPDTGCSTVPHIGLWNNGSAEFITQDAIQRWNGAQPSGAYIYESALGWAEV